MGAQVIKPPGDNEHIMQAAIAAAQAHTFRRRATQYYPQVVATSPSWLFGKVPEDPRGWLRDVWDQLQSLYMWNHQVINTMIEYGSNLLRLVTARANHRTAVHVRQLAEK